MKSLFALFLFLGIFILPTFSQELKEKDKAAIVSAMKLQEQAWNDGDIETFMQTYWHDDSLMFIGSSGPEYGWQNTYERYQKAYPDKASMGKLSFKLANIKKLDKKTAFMFGYWLLASR